MRFERVGGEEPINVDVRVVAATNKNIRAEVAAGRFREDLYFRLNVILIELPSLRERREDIPLLADYFLRKFQADSGTPARHFSPESMRSLAEHEWPGNVRELKNFVERISIMSDEEELTAEVVDYFLGERGAEPGDPVVDEFDGMGLNEARDTFEKRYLEQRLRESGFSISQTATRIGVYPSSLHAKIKKFGIQIDR
jgi:two-component system nitrogen regulation response regulator NtrX